MKLYHFSWGLYPRRVTLYLAEKSIRDIQLIEFDPIDPKTLTRIRELSPLGTVPVLETGDGLVIRQSLAILEYLEERFPEPNLLGETPAARAATRELMALIDEASTLGLHCPPTARSSSAGTNASPDAPARRHRNTRPICCAFRTA